MYCVKNPIYQSTTKHNSASNTFFKYNRDLMQLISLEAQQKIEIYSICLNPCFSFKLLCIKEPETRNHFESNGIGIIIFPYIFRTT